MWWRLGMAVVLGMMVGTSAPLAAPLDPATLAGSWAGTWQNLRFGSTGTITATVSATPQPSPSTITIAFTVSGGVFGCGSSPSGTLTLQSGVDFTAKRVKFTRTDPTFGDVTVRSQKKVVTAKGKNTCGGAGPKSWTVAAAKLKGTTLAGKMVINLGGGTAKTTFSVTKQ